MDDECLRIRPDASTVYPPDGVLAKDNLRRWESRAVPSECPWRGERSAPSAVFQVLKELRVGGEDSQVFSSRLLFNVSIVFQNW